MKEEKNKITKKTNDECLHTCECSIDWNEYRKMIEYYPQRKNEVRFLLIKRGLLINIFLSLIVMMISDNSIITTIFFIIFQMLVILISYLSLNTFLKKAYIRLLNKGEMPQVIKYKFYNEYFTQISEDITLKINYSEIAKSVESDTNFYFEYPKHDMTVIIQKNCCDLKTINFIREKFNNLENHLGDNISFKGINNKQVSNKANSTMQVLFILTLISILIIPYLIKLFLEDYGENFIGLIKNFYLFLYLLPISILSFVLGIKYIRKGLKCTKNIVVGIIAIFILLVLSSFPLLFPGQDYKIIDSYRDIIDVKLPDNGDLNVLNFEKSPDNDKLNYTFINVYYSKNETDTLIGNIQKSDKWIRYNNLTPKQKVLIPSICEINSSSYFLFYNKTTNEYDKLPDNSGIYEMYVMKYDTLTKNLEIHKFKYLYR